jgi:hypothetical protein
LRLWWPHKKQQPEEYQFQPKACGAGTDFLPGLALLPLFAIDFLFGKKSAAAFGLKPFVSLYSLKVSSVINCFLAWGFGTSAQSHVRGIIQ